MLTVRSGKITKFDPVSLSTEISAEILFKKNYEKDGKEIIDSAGIVNLLSDPSVMTTTYADQIIRAYAGLGAPGQPGGLTKEGLRAAISDGVIVEQDGKIIGTNPQILIMESFNQIESNYGVAIYPSGFSDTGDLEIGIIDSGDLTDEEKAAIDSKINTLFSEFMEVGVGITFESDPADPSKKPRLSVNAEIVRVFRNMQADLFGRMIPLLIDGKTFKNSKGKNAEQPAAERKEELARYQKEEINKIIEQFEPKIMNLVNSALADTSETGAHLDKIFEYMTLLENSVIGNDSLPGVDDPEALKHVAGLDRAELILGNEEIKNKIMFDVTKKILANDSISQDQRKKFLEQAVDSYSEIYQNADGVDRLHAKTMVAKLLLESSTTTDSQIRLSPEKESALLKSPLGFDEGSSLYHKDNNPSGIKLEVFATQAEFNAKANEDFAVLANGKLKSKVRRDEYEKAQKKNADTWFVLNGSMWGTDSNGRVSEVRAEILDTPSGRTFISETNHNEGAIGKWSGKDRENNPHSKKADLGFHLLGDNLLGPVNRLNIVPGHGTGTGSGANKQQDYWNLNTFDYSKLFEFPVDLLSRAGRNVGASIKIHYPEDGDLTTRPKSFDVSFTSQSTSQSGDPVVVQSPEMTFQNESQAGMTQKKRQDYSKAIIEMLTNALNDPNAEIDTKWISDARKTITYHNKAYYSPQDGNGMLQPSVSAPQQLTSAPTQDLNLEQAFTDFKLAADERKVTLMGDAQRFIGDYPPPPWAPLPPSGGEVAEVRQILNTLQNSETPIVPGDERVQYLADATNRLNNVQGAIISLDEKIGIFDLTRQAGIKLDPAALQRLGLSGSPFQTPSEGFTPEIREMLEGKSTAITDRLTGPNLADEHRQLATLMGDPAALDAELAGMDETARRDFMQKAAESLVKINGDVFGLPADDLPEVVFSSELNGRGAYDAGSNTITLSEAFLTGNATEALMLVDAVSHEASHAWQAQLKAQYADTQQPLPAAATPGTPEHALAALLTATDQMPQAGQDDVQYLQRWDEKAAFAIGDAVITGALQHKYGENFGEGKQVQVDYRPQYPDGLPEDGREVPAGYEQSQGAMHLHITETALNNSDVPTANTVYANGRKASTSEFRPDGTLIKKRTFNSKTGKIADSKVFRRDGETLNFHHTFDGKGRHITTKWYGNDGETVTKTGKLTYVGETHKRTDHKLYLGNGPDDGPLIQHRTYDAATGKISTIKKYNDSGFLIEHRAHDAQGRLSRTDWFDATGTTITRSEELSYDPVTGGLSSLVESSGNWAFQEDFEVYVSNHADLEKAWNDMSRQGISSASDGGEYKQAYGRGPNEQAWVSKWNAVEGRRQITDIGELTKAEWGMMHFETGGRDEGRTVPSMEGYVSKHADLEKAWNDMSRQGISSASDNGEYKQAYGRGPNEQAWVSKWNAVEGRRQITDIGELTKAEWGMLHFETVGRDGGRTAPTATQGIFLDANRAVLRRAITYDPSTGNELQRVEFEVEGKETKIITSNLEGGAWVKASEEWRAQGVLTRAKEYDNGALLATHEYTDGKMSSTDTPDTTTSYEYFSGTGELKKKVVSFKNQPVDASRIPNPEGGDDLLVRRQSSIYEYAAGSAGERLLKQTDTYREGKGFRHHWHIQDTIEITRSPKKGNGTDTYVSQYRKIDFQTGNDVTRAEYSESGDQVPTRYWATETKGGLSDREPNVTLSGWKTENGWDGPVEVRDPNGSLLRLENYSLDEQYSPPREKLVGSLVMDGNTVSSLMDGQNRPISFEDMDGKDLELFAQLGGHLRSAPGYAEGLTGYEFPEALNNLLDWMDMAELLGLDPGRMIDTANGFNALKTEPNLKRSAVGDWLNTLGATGDLDAKRFARFKNGLDMAMAAGKSIPLRSAISGFFSNVLLSDVNNVQDLGDAFKKIVNAVGYKPRGNLQNLDWNTFDNEMKALKSSVISGAADAADAATGLKRMSKLMGPAVTAAMFGLELYFAFKAMNDTDGDSLEKAQAFLGSFGGIGGAVTSSILEMRKGSSPGRVVGAFLGGALGMWDSNIGFVYPFYGTVQAGLALEAEHDFYSSMDNTFFNYRSRVKAREKELEERYGYESAGLSFDGINLDAELGGNAIDLARALAKQELWDKLEKNPDWPAVRQPGINGNYTEMETPNGSKVQLWQWAEGLEPTLIAKPGADMVDAYDFEVKFGNKTFKPLRSRPAGYKP